MSTREELKREQRKFAAWVAVAAAAHAAVVLFAVLLQLYYVRTHPPLKVVSVSLVSLPGAPGPAGGPPASAPSPKPAPETPAPKAPEPPAAPAPKKAVVPVPKPVPPPEPARKTVPAEDAKAAQRRLDETFAKLRQKTEARQQPASGVGNAIANLQKKVSSQGSGPAQGGGSGGGGGIYGPGGGAVDPYKSKIAGIIQDNWSFSQQLVRNAKGMEVYVAINILPDGTISQIRYDRKAPSEYLNNSVNAALRKSSPLPPLPGEYGRRSIWVGFVFTPEGVTQ
ncbi:MAG: TonB C-terminal domain-containing protein [Chlorobiaceae bacterium]|nr:TonB C-terminal domain-containing protein [Chlorobiaceae bacterium]